jgi:hypothetical protein
MTDEQDARKKRFYHGGDTGLKVGDFILPPNETGTAGLNPLRRKDRVYVIKDVAGVSG